MSGILRRIVRSTRGQGLVEFALVIPIVLFLFFGIFEFGRFFYTRLTMQHAVAEAARFAVTGNVLPDTLGNDMSRVNSIISVIRKNAEGLSLELDRISMDPSDGGGPGDVLRVDAEFSFKFVVPGYREMFPDGELVFSVSTAMKNEPFLVRQDGS